MLQLGVVAFPIFVTKITFLKFALIWQIQKNIQVYLTIIFKILG